MRNMDYNENQKEELAIMNLPQTPTDVEADIIAEYMGNPDLKRISRRYCRSVPEIRKILKRHETI